MKQERLTYLISRFINNIISAAELVELEELLREDEAALVESGSISWQQEQLSVSEDELPDEAEIQRQVNAILAIDRTGTARRKVVAITKWRWAAAVIILLGASAWLWLRPVSQKKPAVQPVTADIAPGGNKAILTLGDGRDILLDSAANGSLAQQGNSAVVKLADGQIVYRPSGGDDNVALINTMTTPRGGQYQLTLPDGTRAWLNAASAITFPSAFTGRERTVKIRGEVYLEVAGDPDRPFIADVDGRSSVEVLGTAFNVNGYPEEQAVRTTLLTGKVRVHGAGRKMIIYPGQQAVAGDTHMNIITDVDTVQALAWKNGIFNFEHLSFPEAARQLERWYDIQIVYEGKVPDIQFRGDMNKGVPLEGVLRILAGFGVNARIEGRKLIVM